MDNNYTYDCYVKKYQYGEHYDPEIDKYLRINTYCVCFFKTNRYLFTEWHRIDGPAKIYKDIDLSSGINSLHRWYINGKHVTEQITKWSKENDIDLDNLTDVDKALIKLVWADYGK